MAEMGELNYHSDVRYTEMAASGGDYTELDIEILTTLKEICQAELECQICYALVLDPLTTNCGHTFCRKCVARVLDHSKLCPACRQPLPMAAGAASEPSNKCITALLQGLCPDLLLLRAEIAAQEEEELGREENTPIFPCTLAYPCMPTFLHIFEPRYRLMIRRAVESGQGKFGMVMYNRRGMPQGSFGVVDYKQYGTMLQIQSLEMLPDGRSLIETRGISRFKILETGMLDGYLVAKTQKIDDISLNEEENMEAIETSTAVAPADPDILPPLESLSTQELLHAGLAFISKGRDASEPWLHERILAAYGQPPNDAAVFPYWLACVLPISEEEKYQLLMITSVRGRLKIVVGWVRRIEAQRW
ncbi:putative atp-dependent protease [Phaeomoniella chlamydospora]|uniref:Putative atp-dependent protease n=1 Tax=Phaeomoniella chlamydospora TaxID=158046 RepID=A0A0G2FQX9_PHACM|nr:putative atp-dependent protease [Phaeomoniella chlamydospora]